MAVGRERLGALPAGKNRGGEMQDQNIPEEIKTVYENLESQVLLLHWRWKIYRQLFAGQPESIFLLNNTAPFFFWNIERVLRQNVYLAIARLLDREGTGERKNLSFPRMLKSIEDQKELNLSFDLKRIFEELVETAKGIKKVRDKRIAHNDLISINKVEPLPKVSRADIENTLKLIRKFMNKISGHYSKTEVYYEGTGSVTDGEALLFHLEKSLEMLEIDSVGEKKHTKMFETGVSIPDPIELIPLYSGWGCPKCFFWNQVMEVTDEVICESCSGKFKVEISRSDE
jgi:hypothetical protein